MLRTAVDIENAKIAIKVLEKTFFKLIADIYKLASKEAIKQSFEFNLELMAHEITSTLQLRDKSSNVTCEIRLSMYDFEKRDFSGGERTILFYKEQIKNAQRMRKILSEKDDTK